MVLPNALAGEVLSERLDIDPVLQGVWMVHATSEDRGAHIKRVDPAEALCRVSASKVRFATGEEMRVRKVLVVKDDGGYPANAIGFEDGVLWIVTKRPGQAYVLVQVFQDGEAETFRALITVDE